ncbi:hypothetical protein FHX10_004556 [Rhizobium sp. BK591]|uniref:hypothetical protein n=1 Tax=Rhizobium sp. BK591 TaxID=2586985 RepID=UPI001609FD02|nr:hypothetical protein [Rhizobium sp. BK591]MBB3745019.1 hypothetical protein [Rhizobium sp. BK591]
MTTKFLRSIASTKVEPEMLEEIADALDESVRTAGGGTVDDPMWIVFHALSGRDVSPLVATAIMFRMQALGELVAAGELSEWQLPGRDQYGAVRIRSSVFHAAAQAKLILTNKRGDTPRFDLLEFKQLALAAATPEGRG